MLNHIRPILAINMITAIMLLISSCAQHHEHTHHNTLSKPFEVTMMHNTPTTVGKEYTGYVRIKDSHTGEAVSAEDVSVTHTEKMHFFIVDNALTHYQHVHPHETDQPGTYEYRFTPTSPLPYTLWGELKRKGHDDTEYIKVDIPHNGLVTSSNIPNIPSTSAENASLSAQWIEDAPLTVGQGTHVAVKLTDKKGNPIEQLDTIMGAKAHMAGFDKNAQHFVHVHPMENSDPSLLEFHVAPEHAGMTKFFLQVKYQGKEIYLPFSRMVQQTQQFSERAQEDTHSHSMQR